VRPPVRGREPPAVAQPLAAPLDLVAGVAQLLDAGVGRDDPGDLLTDRLRVGAAEQVGPDGIDAAGEVEVDVPLGADLAGPRGPSISGENTMRRSVVVSVPPPGCS
jgi:hypothetical protein